MHHLLVVERRGGLTANWEEGPAGSRRPCIWKLLVWALSHSKIKDQEIINHKYFFMDRGFTS